MSRGGRSSHCRHLLLLPGPSIKVCGGPTFAICLVSHATTHSVWETDAPMSDQVKNPECETSLGVLSICAPEASAQGQGATLLLLLFIDEVPQGTPQPGRTNSGSRAMFAALPATC